MKTIHVCYISTCTTTTSTNAITVSVSSVKIMNTIKIITVIYISLRRSVSLNSPQETYQIKGEGKTQ